MRLQKTFRAKETMSDAPILIIEMGLPRKGLLSVHGRFGEWFSKAYQKISKDLPIDIISVEEVTAESLAQAAGIILSGAEEGVYEKLPWRKRFDGLMEDAINSGSPVLGVCFGHQYLADLLGGCVEHRPDKREIGCFEVSLSEEGMADPLFAGLERKILVIESHNDQVTALPRGATLLASSEAARIQSFRWRKTVRGVQFHPEMTWEIAATAIRLTREEAEAYPPHPGGSRSDNRRQG